MWKIAINYARGTGQVGDFSACSYLLFWLKNIDCKSILQKKLNQFGLVASKYERKSRYKSNFQCVSLRRRVCLKMSRHMFLQSTFQFGFYRRNLVCSLEFSLEFIIHRGKPKFINLPVKFPAARSKFQFCTTARSKHIIIFTRTVLPLLKITPHNTQNKKKKIREFQVVLLKNRVSLGLLRDTYF